MKTELVFPEGTGVSVKGIHHPFQQRTRLVQRGKTLGVFRDPTPVDHRGFTLLSAMYGAWIESENPVLVRKLLGLNEGDPRIRPYGTPQKPTPKAGLRLVASKGTPLS